MSLLVPAVVLAAGRSIRMGRAKALLPTLTEGETFVTRIVRVLRQGGVADVVVVVSTNGTAVRSVLSSLEVPPRIVINPDPDQGQLSSLLLGLQAVDRPGVAGMLLTLVDVPLVGPGIVKALLQVYERRLLQVYERTRAPIVRPSRGGQHGHPVLFDRTVFGALRGADPAIGAKPVIRAYLDDAVDVPVEDEGPFVDVDTPSDYERVFGRQISIDRTR